MNHYENPFNIKISLYWDTSSLQTILLIKTIPKDKLIEEIINREFSNKVKQKITPGRGGLCYNTCDNKIRVCGARGS